MVLVSVRADGADAAAGGGGARTTTERDQRCEAPGHRWKCTGGFASGRFTPVARFLSAEWIDIVRGAAAPTVGDTTVECAVTGGPDGDVKLHVCRQRSGARRRSRTPTCRSRCRTRRPSRSSQGELEPSVAFMQGRMKTAGDPGKLLDLLAATAELRVPRRPRARRRLDRVLKLSGGNRDHAGALELTQLAPTDQRRACARDRGRAERDRGRGTHGLRRVRPNRRTRRATRRCRRQDGGRSR